MPKFKVKAEESANGKKITFNKSSDYKAVTLNGDKLQKVRLLHVEQANKLIESKKATEAKKPKVETSESTRSVTVEPKND